MEDRENKSYTGALNEFNVKLRKRRLITGSPSCLIREYVSIDGPARRWRIR